jgi:hypothetical protein
MKPSKPQVLWALQAKNGNIVAAFRFKPKRVRQGGKGPGSYWAWTDCNGPKFHAFSKSLIMNTIEGSMNAKLIRVTVTPVKK